MKKILTTGLALTALALSGTAIAQDSPVTAPRQVVQNFDTDNLIPILQEMGLEWRGVSVPNSNGGDNKNVLIVRSPNGFTMTLMPSACLQGTNSGCVGLNTVAGFKGNIPQSSVNAFNYRYPFVTAGMDQSGAAYISRYDISDYGTMKGNIASSIYNFIGVGAMFSQSLYGAKQTVSLESFSSDMKANSLNRQALAEAGINQVHAHKSLDIHSAEFDRASELMEVLVKADKKAPGKILNTIGK